MKAQQTAQYTDIRQHILDQGKAIITRKGFAGVGLNEILTAADVPKGSFYHYFKSKELFGEAMLSDYMTRYLAEMDSVLRQPGQSAAQSLMDYWASWTSYDASGGTCDCRCLVVKLSSEVADMSEAMRVTLLGGTNRIVARLAVSIEQAVADGSLSAIADPAHTALTLYQMWLGAAMLTKLRRDASALQAAWQATLSILQMPAGTVAAR
ncbi:MULTISPECIES: TetR/AcrR family transcriptional regulator [unclassified Janthinobacterium]|uniref:TetR/AcrR family transcriptional regulator n=1 Tax=unclassified Janthinobacterium TaxID=2610881 RepID=UPI0016203901|nr:MULTISPECIES: TetR/AcrR family transcriptional regulator [unclassified Janthinobacterium]MBB5605939.1 TetR/AcrR family transcriptional repressor of nem operon [Janthinobacterium sp. S3T4]MBB5611143.1 TetR/AcrR family transcriptional repressor of nem operon [Janthinobacterium sp. S3M3]